MRLIRAIWVIGVLGAWLGGTAFAHCHASTEAIHGVSGDVPTSIGSAAGQVGGEDRTVLVELALRKSGGVRDARVIKGPTTLRAAAIKAVKRQKHHFENVWPFDGRVTVQVRFPQDKAASPEIRQVIPGGVPSCIPLPAVVRISPAVMQYRLLNRVEPVYPAEMQKVEATLVLRVRIDKDGNVYKADKVSGPDALVPAAIEAVKNWKYQPLLLNGERIEVDTTVDLKVPNESPVNHDTASWYFFSRSPLF